MDVLFYLLLAACAGVALWTLVSPRSVWYAFRAWSYRNPEANEPSEAWYALQRIGAVIGLVLMVSAGVALRDTPEPDSAPATTTTRDPKARYQACLKGAKLARSGIETEAEVPSPEEVCAHHLQD